MLQSSKRLPLTQLFFRVIPHLQPLQTASGQTQPRKLMEVSENFFEMLEAVASEIEQFFTDVAKEVTNVVDAFVEVSEEIADHMQNAFETELEQRIGYLIDPILEAYLGIELTIEETTQPVIHTVEPFLKDHPVCVGCRHYHGQSYGGTMLVCGMHPYGWEGEKCPDWQSMWHE